MKPKSVLERLQRDQWSLRGGPVTQFGANLGPTWVHFGSKNGTKNEQKTIQKSFKICMALGTHVGADLGRFEIENGAMLAPK